MIAKRIVIALVLAILPLQAFALTTDELLALVAMPLAVAAVSDVTGVPISELANVAATLNSAYVPPAQFVEVMRYVPAALVVEVPGQPRFVQYVDTRFDRGITGLALVTDIERQLPIYGIPSSEITVVAPALRRVVDATFFPPIVRTRLTEARTHPHGGPPGQLKKQLGLQTGAEVVHGTSAGKVVNKARTPKRNGGDDRPAKVNRGNDDRGNGGKGRGNAGGGKGNADGGGKGGGKGKGKG
ncbi:MAG: hypothetical protein WA208_20375 [Thermoanaerobaculia bacterium]